MARHSKRKMSKNLKGYLGAGEEPFINLSGRKKAKIGGRLMELLSNVSDGAVVPLLHSCLGEYHVRKLCALKGLVTNDNELSSSSQLKMGTVKKEEAKEEIKDEPEGDLNEDLNITFDSDVDEKMAEVDADIERGVWNKEVNNNHQDLHRDETAKAACKAELDKIVSELMISKQEIGKVQELLDEERLLKQQAVKEKEELAKAEVKIVAELMMTNQDNLNVRERLDTERILKEQAMKEKEIMAEAELKIVAELIVSMQESAQLREQLERERTLKEQAVKEKEDFAKVKWKVEARLMEDMSKLRELLNRERILKEQAVKEKESNSAIHFGEKVDVAVQLKLARDKIESEAAGKRLLEAEIARLAKEKRMVVQEQRYIFSRTPLNNLPQNVTIFDKPCIHTGS